MRSVATYELTGAAISFLDAHATQIHSRAVIQNSLLSNFFSASLSAHYQLSTNNYQLTIFLSMQTAILTGLTLGALGSLHCAGMCGPLVAACMGAGKGNTSVNKASLLYQIGRISMYVTLGLLFGYFGSSLELLAGQTYTSIFAGGLLIFIGVFGRKIEAKIGATTVLAKAFGYTSARFGSAALLGFGLLNGLLPCGLVYTALAASLAFGDAALGAVFMFFFGVATSPLLMAVSYVSQRWRGLSSKLFPVFSLIAGLVLIYRGVQAELPADWMNFLVMNPQLECH